MMGRWEPEAREYQQSGNLEDCYQGFVVESYEQKEWEPGFF